jgi:hypothetical protein
MLRLSVPLVWSTHVRATSRSVCVCAPCLIQNLTVYSICFSQKTTVVPFFLLHVPRATFFAKWRAVDQQQSINCCGCHLKNKSKLIRYVILLPLPFQLVSLRPVLMTDGQIKVGLRINFEIIISHKIAVNYCSIIGMSPCTIVYKFQRPAGIHSPQASMLIYQSLPELP